MIERHPADGEAMLARYPHLAEVASVVRAHHERPDGRGYPDGLAGDEIPVAAAIVSVVDAWDAMTSDRPYRAGMPRERAEAVLRAGAGTQWLPEAVDELLGEVDEGGPAVVARLEAVGRLYTTETEHHCDCLTDVVGAEAGSRPAREHA